MDERVPRFSTPQFTKPDQAFHGLNQDDMAALLVASADVTLVVDLTGTILDAAFAPESIFEEIGKSWVGEPLVETVSEDTRGKVDLLLKDIEFDDHIMRRQINHLAPSQADVPVSYAVLGRNAAGNIIISGRNLQKISDEQRRLMNAQLSMERAYARIQASELKYRQLFQSSTEAVLIVDSGNMKVLEANDTASRLFGFATNKLNGQKVRDLFSKANLDVVEAITECALSGKALEKVNVGVDGALSVLITATMLRDDKSNLLVLRLTPTGSEDADLVLPEKRVSLKALQNLPDGFLVTSPDGVVLTANDAFAQLLQISDLERVRGSKFERWFERAGVDFNVLISNLKEHGVVRRFATSLRGEAGLVENVEVGAIHVNGDGQSIYGFMVRGVGPTERQAPAGDGVLPYSPEQLTSLVGHMSLKDVVRETTSVIERLCIEAALELTGDNRASAAQLLGLSRQSLYDKLGRYNLDG